MSVNEQIETTIFDDLDVGDTFILIEDISGSLPARCLMRKVATVQGDEEGNHHNAVGCPDGYLCKINEDQVVIEIFS